MTNRMFSKCHPAEYREHERHRCDFVLMIHYGLVYVHRSFQSLYDRLTKEFASLLTCASTREITVPDRMPAMLDCETLCLSIVQGFIEICRSTAYAHGSCLAF